MVTHEGPHCPDCSNISQCQFALTFFTLRKIRDGGRGGGKQQSSSFSLSKKDTWNFGGDPSGDRGPKALCCAGLDGEGVGGPWVQTHKEVVGFIPELEHFSPLAGEVGTRVQRANSLIVDLHNKPANKPINTSSRKLDGDYLEDTSGRQGGGTWAWSAGSAAAVHPTGYPSLLILHGRCPGALLSDKSNASHMHAFQFSSGHIKRKWKKKVKLI